MSAFHRRGSLTPIGLAACGIAAIGAVAAIDLRGGAALASLTLAGILGSAWAAGNRVWPSRERVPAPRVAASPETARAVLAALERPVRIAVVGDIQNGLAEFADLIAEARRRGCDLILLLGDCVNIGRAERFALLRDALTENALNVPVLAVPGNHDIGDDGTLTAWREWVGPVHWRLDVRGWRILGLDDAAGSLSQESVALLRESAADAPERGTVLVSHRQLFAAAGESRDRVRARAKQLASAGLVPPPALALAGHGKANEQFVDAAGTRHFVQGENCDRSSQGESREVTAATLTLGDGPPGYEVWRVPRRARLRHELRRILAGGVYPALRGRAVLVLLLMAGLLAFAAAAMTRVAV